MNSKGRLLATKLDDETAFLVKGVAKSFGLSVSEFLRFLIIQELDKRGLLTNRYALAKTVVEDLK